MGGIDVLITAVNLVAKLLRQAGNAAHECAANSEYMQLHASGYTTTDAANTPSNR